MCGRRFGHLAGYLGVEVDVVHFGSSHDVDGDVREFFAEVV
jgi:hypothetical protein